jgi:hypothetical protein
VLCTKTANDELVTLVPLPRLGCDGRGLGSNLATVISSLLDFIGRDSHSLMGSRQGVRRAIFGKQPWRDGAGGEGEIPTGSSNAKVMGRLEPRGAANSRTDVCGVGSRLTLVHQPSGSVNREVLGGSQELNGMRRRPQCDSEDPERRPPLTLIATFGTRDWKLHLLHLQQQSGCLQDSLASHPRIRIRRRGLHIKTSKLWEPRGSWNPAAIGSERNMRLLHGELYGGLTSLLRGSDNNDGFGTSRRHTRFANSSRSKPSSQYPITLGTRAWNRTHNPNRPTLIIRSITYRRLHHGRTRLDRHTSRRRNLNELQQRYRMSVCAELP